MKLKLGASTSQMVTSGEGERKDGEQSFVLPVVLLNL